MNASPTTSMAATEKLIRHLSPPVPAAFSKAISARYIIGEQKHVTHLSQAIEDATTVGDGWGLAATELAQAS